MLKDATVAIEDERFYQHKGVDYEGVVRAAVKNLTSRRDRAGRLDDHDAARPQPLHLEASGTYQRKIREAKLAEELENEHSKEWILDKYLDTVPYGTVGGQTAIGAARRGADVLQQAASSELTLPEAALLAGLPQAPSDYSPIARARRRQGAPQRGAGARWPSSG